MTEETVHFRKNPFNDIGPQAVTDCGYFSLYLDQLWLCGVFFLFVVCFKRILYHFAILQCFFHICCPWFRNSVTECDRLSAEALEAPAAEVHNLWISPKLLSGFTSLFCEELKHKFSFYLQLIWFLKTLCEQPGSLVNTSIWRLAGCWATELSGLFPKVVKKCFGFI